MAGKLEWRNWQTHETQNLALRKQRGGSTPPSSTNISLDLDKFFFPLLVIAKSLGASSGASWAFCEPLDCLSLM